MTAKRPLNRPVIALPRWAGAMAGIPDFGRDFHVFGQIHEEGQVFAHNLGGVRNGAASGHASVGPYLQSPKRTKRTGLSD